MKLSAMLLVILFGLASAGKTVPKTYETYAPQAVPLYVESYRPEPSKKEEIKAKISSKKDTIHTKLEELKPKIAGFKEEIKAKISSKKGIIHTKLEELKPKIEAKIHSTKEAITTKLEALKPKIVGFKEHLKAKISDKISDIKSKFESKHTKPDHYSPRYVLVRAQPESKYKW